MTSTSNPPLEAPAGFSPQHQHHNKDSRGVVQPTTLIKPQQPPLAFLGSSRTLPVRTTYNSSSQLINLAFLMLFEVIVTH